MRNQISDTKYEEIHDIMTIISIDVQIHLLPNPISVYIVNIWMTHHNNFKYI